MWFDVVFSLIDNDMRHHSSQQILTTVMARIMFDKSTDNDKPHLIFFTISTSKTMFFFFSERDQ